MSKKRAHAFLMRNRITLGMSFALVLLFTFARPASAFYYNMGMFWKRASAAFSWPFTTGTDAQYSFGSSIQITGNAAKLKPNDQVDSDSTSTGFGGGTLNNALWDSTNGYVRLGLTGGCDGTGADCASTVDFSAYEQAVGWAPKYANLVGYWKLNGVGSIATGNTLTAVVGPNLTAGNTNASGMAYATGQLKQGVNFDGTDDYASASSTIDLTGTTNITIGFWLKWNSYANDDKNVLEFSTNFNSGAGRFRIAPNDASGKFAMCFRGNGASGGYNCAEFTRPSAGVFHHYAVVFDQSQSAANEVTPYVDGVAQSYTKSNSTENTGTFANQTLYVMTRAGTSNFGAGVIDDLAIWNTSLSATEIATIYSTQNPLPVSTAELDSSWAPKWSNLVSYWKMNNNWNDSKGTINLTAYNGVTFSAPAKIGSHAGTFDGVDDEAHVRDMTVTYVNDSYSFAGWFKANPASSGRLDIVQAYQWTAAWVSVSYIATGLVAGNGIKFEGMDSNGVTLSVTSPKTYRDGLWHHFVGVRDKAAAKLLLYMDGELVISTTDNRTGSFNLSPSICQIGISSSGAGTTFNGSLDDIAHWNTALTAADVQTLYSRQSAKYSGTLTSRVMDAFATGMSWTTLSWVPTLPFMKELPDYASGAIQNETSTDYSSLVGSTGATGDNNLMTGIIGLWHLNEASGTTGTGSVADDSGQGNTGTPTSVTFGINGKLGNGARFGGSPSKIITTNTSVSINVQNFSNSVWFRTTSTADGKITSISNDTHPLQILSGKIRTCLPGFCAAGSTTISDGQWHHAVLVSDATSARVYLDGNSTPEVTNSTIVPSTVTNPFMIGTACNSASGTGSCSATLFFVGDLDEVALWNRPLSVGEVKQLYRRGANRLKHQVRICTASDCSDDSTGANWKGPDGTNQTYFSELNNNSVPLAMTGDVKKTLPSMLFSNFTSPVGTSRYFQYRTILESDDTGIECNYGSAATWCSPELKSVTVDPTHYDSTSPTIIGQTGVSYFALSNFTETLGASCPSGVGYNLGVGTAYSNATWYWWDATANAGAGGWVAADGTVTKSNSAATIASHANTFRAQVGTSNTVYFKAFLKSSGSTACELDQLDIAGQK